MFPVLASLHYAFIELTEHFLMQYSSFLRLVRFHDRSYRYQNLQIFLSLQNMRIDVVIDCGDSK